MYLAQVLLKPYISPFLILNIGPERQLNSAKDLTSQYFFINVVTDIIRYNGYLSVITDIIRIYNG